MTAIWGEHYKPFYDPVHDSWDQVDGDTDCLDGEDQELIEEAEDLMLSMSSVYRESTAQKEKSDSLQITMREFKRIES